ncbi:hypothetical protein L6R52_12880 [Myxococcota bacterium]|nr:hypothetical protein [Myxococcota bacterium]
MNRRTSMYWRALGAVSVTGLAAGLIACGSDGNTPPDEDTRALLERSVEREVTCTRRAGPLDQKPRSWSWGGHSVAARGDEVFVVRTEAIRENPFDAAPTSIVFGALLEDGTLSGPESVVDVGDAGVSRPVATVVGDELWMLWADDTDVHLARDTAAGVAGPTPLGLDVANESWNTTLAIAAGHDGAGLVFASGVSGADYSTSFVRLSAAGAVVGTPIALPAQQERPAITLRATDDGWLMIRRSDGALVSQRLALDGTPSEPVVLARDDEANRRWVGRGTGFDRGAFGLVEHGDGFVTAWSEATWSDADAWAAVKLAKLDASGAIVGTPIWARAPEADVDEVEPNLTRFGDHVALTWARGSHIYVCAGCMPDHRVDLVLFDPAAMTPVSDVATVPAFETGGLLRRDEAWAGATLRMAIENQFHVHGEPATAVLGCE